MLAGVSLAGCYTSHELSADQTAAVTVQAECMKRAAASLDDGFSDPIAIGIAVAAACSAETQQSDAAMTAGHSLDYQIEYRKDSDRDALRLAVTAVVLHRKQMRGG